MSFVVTFSIFLKIIMYLRMTLMDIHMSLGTLMPHGSCVELQGPPLMSVLFSILFESVFIGCH